MEMRNRISKTVMRNMKRFLPLLALICLLLPTASSAMVRPLPYATEVASFQSTSLQPQSEYVPIPIDFDCDFAGQSCRNDPVDVTDPLGLDENTVSISIPDDRSPVGSRIDVYQNTSAFYGCPQDTTGLFKPVVRKLEKNAIDIVTKSTVEIAKEMFELSPLSSLYTAIAGKDAVTGRKMKRAAGVIGLVTWVSPASRVEQKVANQAARVEASVAREAIVAAKSETVIVRHYTDTATRGLINGSGELRSGSYVTLPAEISPSAGHLQIEDILEINPGRGSTFVDLPTPASNLRIPANGPTTSGGTWQRQLVEPTPVDPNLWRRPPGRPAGGG